MPEVNFNTIFSSGNVHHSEFIKKIDVVSNTQLGKISAIPFGCETSIEDRLLNRMIGPRLVEKIKQFDEGISQFKISHIKRSKLTEEEITGNFFIYKAENYENIYLALTFEQGDFYHHELKPLLNSLYPDFLFAFYKSNSLRDLINSFAHLNSLTEIIIKRASQKLRFEDDKSMSAVTWPNMKLDEAFSFIHENNGWFKSLKFEGRRHEKTIAEISIDRHARIRTDRQFEMVFNGFIVPAFEILNSNYQLYGKRSRKENIDRKPKPLSIDFKTSLFENVSTNKVFINAMNSLEKASVSVVHGNPYIQMSVIDYIDGSNMDIWVLSENQIIIVPQMKGTIAGIKRLVNHIFDTFAEGEVNNYELIN